MDFVLLVYVSRPKEECTSYEVIKIIEKSREKNARLGITGILCYDRKYFIQLIEGPRESVNTLYHTIANDSRHYDLTILSYDYTVERMFESWEMAYISASRLDYKKMQKFVRIDSIDPYHMSGEMAVAFLKEVKRLTETILAESPRVSD